jgi:hypothetical protein
VTVASAGVLTVMRGPRAIAVDDVTARAVVRSPGMPLRALS